MDAELFDRNIDVNLMGGSILLSRLSIPPYDGAGEEASSLPAPSAA